MIVPPNKDPNEFAKTIRTTSFTDVYLQCPHLTDPMMKAIDFAAAQVQIAVPMR
jgi:hypothetical protein